MWVILFLSPQPLAPTFGPWLIVPCRGPWPSSPAPLPIYFFTSRGPKQFFTATNNGSTFSRLLTMEVLFHYRPPSKMTFSRPLVITVVCYVFFYSSFYTYSKTLFPRISFFFSQSIAVWMYWLLFIWCKLNGIFR